MTNNHKKNAVIELKGKFCYRIINKWLDHKYMFKIKMYKWLHGTIRHIFRLIYKITIYNTWSEKKYCTCLFINELNI